jgi:hypothetical protein
MLPIFIATAAVPLPRLQDLAATITAQSVGDSINTDPTRAYNHLNCVDAATAFFNNVRTPATLLVIPAINNLWVDITSTTRRRKHPVAQTLYTMALMETVLLELVCVFVATVTGTRLMSGGFDPMSSDAVTLLVREFELPYLTTHLAFITGLSTFMFGIGLRTWIQFGDIHTGMGRALTLLTTTFVGNMVAYFHNSINRFHFGLPGLLVRFIVLYLQAFGVVGILSLASVALCCYYVAITIRDQLEKHGAPTPQLSVQQLPQASPLIKQKKFP